MEIRAGAVAVTIAAAAAVTFFMRVLPFFAFSGNRKMPEWLDRLGQALPPAIMAVLVVYCIKDAIADIGMASIPKFAAVIFTAVIHRLWHNTLISIVGGTAVYMILLRML